MLSFEQMRARADAIARSEAAPLAIAAIPALAAGLVPAALARLGDILPAQIQLQSQSAEAVVQSVLTGRAEIGFASLPFDHPGLHSALDRRGPLASPCWPPTTRLPPPPLLPIASVGRTPAADHG